MTMAGESKRIVVFNVNWIGDAVFSTAVIRNLRYNFPASHIACIIPPRCLPVLEGNPYLNEIIIFDEKGRHRGVFGMIAFCLKLRRKRFDVAYLLHRSMSRALIVFAAGIRGRIGYYTRKRGFLLTKKPFPPDLLHVHRAEYYLDLLRRTGITVRDSHTDFFVADEHRKQAAALLAQFCRGRDFLIGINPGGNWQPKRWPEEQWALLAKRLAEEFSAKVVITGGPEDAQRAAAIERASGTNVLSLCGRCSLKEFAAVARTLDVFITADSGPLHIAAATGARHIVALFGPTDPKLTGPVQGVTAVVLHKPVGCAIPCYEVACPDNKCMKAISVDDVLEQVRKIYASHQ
jgi:heptosyltransferase II